MSGRRSCDEVSSVCNACGFVLPVHVNVLSSGLAWSGVMYGAGPGHCRVGYASVAALSGMMLIRCGNWWEL